MSNLPKIIYKRVLIVCLFINVGHDIPLHTLVDDNDISPVINTSTDHKKGRARTLVDVEYYCNMYAHSEILYKYSNRTYSTISTRGCIAGNCSNVIYLRVYLWVGIGIVPSSIN